MVTKYEVDGIRIDTCLEVPTDFWGPFTQSAGVYSMCECDNGSIDLNAMFQGPVDATLNYPLFF